MSNYTDSDRVTNCKFIATEPVGVAGETGERQVWEAVKQAFASRQGLAYWRYPIFSRVGKFRKEPDILIVDRVLGVVVIEVKAIAIEQISSISGHSWQFQQFYTASGNPYQQAERQLFALLEYCDREPILQQNVTARVLVSLPFVSETDWKSRGFDRLPSSPPILFADRLSKPEAVLEAIASVPPVKTGTSLDDRQWKLLLATISGTPVLDIPPRRVLASEDSRAAILEIANRHRFDLDLQQEKIAKEIPPGAQRIRGIAGSGKTILLCQKAAWMHLKYPDWDIAFVFLTRTLYDPLAEQLDKWLNYFSNGQLSYSLDNPKLRLLHAWGAKDRPGLYGCICEAAGMRKLTSNDIESGNPMLALATPCDRLLQASEIPQLFDTILIDEGQDLVVNETTSLKFGQPFYEMAYRSLRPVISQTPDQKRLIWAYDEMQSLASTAIPTASQLFGESLANWVTGRYPGGIEKTQVMSRCYRTPHPILTAAHAMGMGWLRSPGMLSGTTIPADWNALGYEVAGEFKSEQWITLHRPRDRDPNPLSQLWKHPLIEFEAFPSRQEELVALSDRLWYNLKQDGLRPSRDILVVVLGNNYEASQLERQVASFLMESGLDIFIPTAKECNIVNPQGTYSDRDRFWCPGGITVSRIFRAKGNEAPMVYLVGLDNIAKNENNVYLRNQLFVAMTRSRGWLNISGIGNYPLYRELHDVLQSGDTFRFCYRHPPQREIGVSDVMELQKRYEKGSRNFQDSDLENAYLCGVNLSETNLINARLTGANLQNVQLDGANLSVANLSRANLCGASLCKAKLVGTILTDANLAGADLTNDNLSGADLTGANLTNSNLAGTVLDDALLPEAIVPRTIP